MHPLKRSRKEELSRIAHGRRQSRRDGTAGGRHRQLRKYKWKLVRNQSSLDFVSNFQNVYDYISLTLVL